MLEKKESRSEQRGGGGGGGGVWVSLCGGGDRNMAGGDRKLTGVLMRGPCSLSDRRSPDNTGHGTSSTHTHTHTYTHAHTHTRTLTHVRGESQSEGDFTEWIKSFWETRIPHMR